MKIMLIEKREIFREGLAKILGSMPRCSKVITCSNANEAYGMAQEFEPNVIIMDIVMNEDYPETIKKLKLLLPDSKVAILTHSENESDLFSAMRSGAVAYLTKDIKIDELINDIYRIQDGAVIVSPPMSLKLLNEFIILEGIKNIVSEKSNFGLSDREKEILALVARGASNRKIAQSLFVSENTVRVHLHKILYKLKVQNRFEAAVLAIRDNIVE